MAIAIDGMRESTFEELISQYAPDELHLFDNLRVFIEANGNFWFIGKDVASIMGYSDTDDAIRRHVPDQYKLTRRFTGSGQGRDMIIINEQALYALAMRSKLPQAFQFQNWVYRVISRIRQSGGYISHDPRLKQVVDIIPEHLRPAFDRMYDRGVQSQQQIIDKQNILIDEQQNDIEDYQEMIDCNNINRIEELEEEIDLYKRMIHDYEGALGEKCYSFLTPSTLERMKNIVK